MAFVFVMTFYDSFITALICYIKLKRAKKVHIFFRKLMVQITECNKKKEFAYDCKFFRTIVLSLYVFSAIIKLELFLFVTK